MTKQQLLSELGAELEELEAETFEVVDHIDDDANMAATVPCSTSTNTCSGCCTEIEI